MRVSGWALRFDRVPQSSARIPHGFHKAPQCSTKGVSCARRLKSHRMKIALLMGGTLSKTESMVFSTLSLLCDLLTCSGKCWLVANQITSLRNSRCSRVNAWHCCLVGFGFQKFHEAARAMRSEGFHQILQKLWGSPEERFQQSFTLSSAKVA